MNRYKLKGGPSDGVVITFPEHVIPVNRYLYFNGNMYWVTTFVADEDGIVTLEWDGRE